MIRSSLDSRNFLNAAPPLLPLQLLCPFRPSEASIPPTWSITTTCRESGRQNRTAGGVRTANRSRDEPMRSPDRFLLLSLAADSELTSNLIDFSTDVDSSRIAGPEYVNNGVQTSAGGVRGGLRTRAKPAPVGIPATATAHTGRDPFDMSKYTTLVRIKLFDLLASQTGKGNIRSLCHPFRKTPLDPAFPIEPLLICLLTFSGPFSTTQPSGVSLHLEEWFHGPISRRDAECRLRADGDFLVRESQGSPGQYVLTGMQSNSKKHLLLVDPEGVVRKGMRGLVGSGGSS